MAQSRHVCPNSSRGMMPMLIHSAAHKGDITEITKWLENEGDVNAADMSNRTVVHIACENNHLHLLKELLKHPNIHLNQQTKSSAVTSLTMKNWGTPLSIACSNGHAECVEALLSSPSECKIDISRQSGPSYKAILFAANQNHWNVVKMMLNVGSTLEPNEAGSLFVMAVRSNESDIVKDIIDREIHFKPTVNGILLEIYNKSFWTHVGAEKLFKKSVKEGQLWSLKVINLALEKKDWKMVEAMLRILNEAVKINTSLAEAVLEKAPEDVDKLLVQEHMDDDVLHGVLLVAAVQGTTEEIVTKLFGQRKNYSIEVLNYVLLLASLNGRVELLPILFERVQFNYTTLSQANYFAQNHCGSTQLIRRAMKRLAVATIPLGESVEESQDT